MFGVILLVLAVCNADVQRAPTSRSKRSDDPQGWESVVGQLSQKQTQQDAQLTALQNAIAQMQQQLQQQHDKMSLHIAFHARLSTNNHVHVSRGQTIKFDYVIANEGSAYDQSTGVFTAPVGGVYVFLFSSRPYEAGHAGSVYLYVDGHYSAAFIDNSNDMGTGHFVCHLNKGGKAWVAGNSPDTYLYSYDTTFTGFLLNPDW